MGPGASIAVTDYNHGTPGLCGGGMLANEFIRLPIHMVDRVPKGTPRWGLGHKQAMRSWHKRSIVIMGPTQQIPTADGARDARSRGARQVGPAGGAHPGQCAPAHVRDRRHAIASAPRRGSRKRERSIRSPMGGHPTMVSAGQHQAGTCRMGDDPRGSVVNKFCQIHDVDNVFVIDGSVHVTNGGFNPALTIMAVAYFASDALVRNWKGTKFRS